MAAKRTKADRNARAAARRKQEIVDRAISLNSAEKAGLLSGQVLKRKLEAMWAEPGVWHANGFNRWGFNNDGGVCSFGCGRPDGTWRRELTKRINADIKLARKQCRGKHHAKR